MMRITFLAAFTVSFICCSGCERENNHLRQGVSVDDPINDVSAVANDEGATKAKNVELLANQKTEKVQMDFMKLREDYRQKVTAGMVDLDRKVLILQGKGKYSNGKLKQDLETSLTQIRADRYDFTNDYKSLDTVTSANWEVTKVRLDNKWLALVALVDSS
jgi:hypothetical protein